MAAPERPVTVVTVFGQKVLELIMAEIAAAPMNADWLIGTYGVNKGQAEKVTSVRGCRYAPVFAIQPKTGRHAREQRRLSKADAALVGDAAHAGPVPGSSAGTVIPPRDRRPWGIELGRRYRDAMRAGRAKGIPIETWQFDEVLSECRNSRAHREFIGGILRGLAEGRPKLGDMPERGLVWTGFLALRDMPGLAIDGDVKRFWEDLDAAALFLVGEEYPSFTGLPSTHAEVRSRGQRRLIGAGGIRRRLGERYVVGMSPGFLPSETGLGGNVNGNLSAAQITKFRRAYIDARVAVRRPRGFGQFNLVRQNAESARVQDAIQSLRHAAKQLRQ